MARIHKMPSGKWLVEIRKKNHPMVCKSFHLLDDARKFAKQIESSMDRGTFEDYSTASGTTLKDILIKYRNEKTAFKKGADSETSKINYLIRHSIALNTLMKLRSHHIYKLMKQLGQTRKPSTVNKYVHLICHAWRVAKREWGINLPAENPCDMVTMNKVRDARDRVLTAEEYKKLLDACEKQTDLPILKDIVMFAYQTGARQGEILKLKRDHIDFKRQTCIFYDTKTNEDRTIPLATDTLNILKRHIFGEYVFDCHDRRLRKWFDRAKRLAGITDFRFHDLRACFATNALLSGMSIAQVSAITGHKDWSQLKRYTRIKPTDLLDAINNVVKFNIKS